MTKGQSEAGQIHGGQSQGTAGRSNDRNIAPMGKVTSSGASTTERSDELGAATTEKPYTGELLRMNGNFGDMFWSGGKGVGTSIEQTGGPSTFSSNTEYRDGDKDGQKKKEGAVSSARGDGETVSGNGDCR